MAWIAAIPFAIWAVIRLFGLDSGYQLVDELHPDVVTVEEFTPRFGRELAAAGLGSRLKYHVIDPERRARGTAIYSRFPLRRLPSPDFVFKMARAEASLPGGKTCGSSPSTRSRRVIPGGSANGKKS